MIASPTASIASRGIATWKLPDDVKHGVVKGTLGPENVGRRTTMPSRTKNSASDSSSVRARSTISLGNGRPEVRCQNSRVFAGAIAANEMCQSGASAWSIEPTMTSSRGSHSVWTLTGGGPAAGQGGSSGTWVLRTAIAWSRISSAASFVRAAMAPARITATDGTGQQESASQRLRPGMKPPTRGPANTDGASNEDKASVLEHIAERG